MTDSVVPDHDAILSKNIQWISGPSDWAISANASSQGYVALPPVDLREAHGVTVALWTNRNYGTDGGVLFETGGDSQDSSTGFALLPDDAICHGLRATMRGNVGTTANCYSQPTSGVWHQLAVVYDKSQTGGDQIAFYVDGALQHPTWNLSSATNTNNFGNLPIYLFSRGGTSQFSSGAVQDVLIYNSALTRLQIQNLQQNNVGALGGCPGQTQGCVQVKSASSSGSQTVSLTLSNSVTAGDTLALGLRWESATVNLSNVSLSGGCAVASGFVQPTPSNGTNPSRYGLSSALLTYGVVTTGGPCTISANLSSAVPLQYLTVHELHVGSYDCSSMNHQDSPGSGSNAVTSLTCTTAKNGDYLLGEYFDMGSNGGTWSAGTGFALETNSGSEGSQTEDRIQASAGAVAATFTTSVGWAHPTTGLLAFQPVGSGSPNFTISASPTSLSIPQNGQGSSTITTAISGGFNDPISLSASGTPSGVTVTFNPASIPAPGSGSSVMTISVAPGTVTGTYPITVTGAGGTLRQSTTVTLTVTGAASFTVSASPSALTILQGSHGSSTLTTTISGGFNSPISFTAVGMPAGTTFTFNPVMIPAPGAGNSVLTIAVGSSTQEGTYPIAITAIGNGIRQTVTVSLTVTAQVALSWTASTSPGIAGYNIYRGLISGGPYAKINSSLDSNTTYNDQEVQDGNTYYYVTTAVNNEGEESSYSNQSSAIVP